MMQNKELNISIRKQAKKKLICKGRNTRSETWTTRSETWTLASGCSIKKADDFDLTLKGTWEMVAKHNKNFL